MMMNVIPSIFYNTISNIMLCIPAASFFLTKSVFFFLVVYQSLFVLKRDLFSCMLSFAYETLIYLTTIISLLLCG